MAIDKTAYFKTHAQMGRRLGQKLVSLRDSDTAILALSPGAALIAVEISKLIDAPVGLLLLKDIVLPDKRTIVGVINNNGHFTRDVAISQPQMDDFEMEYRNALARSKASAVSELHKTGKQDKVRPEFFQDKIVIFVNDVSHSGTVFKAGSDFLRPVRTDAQIYVSAVSIYEAQYYMQEHGDAHLIEHITDKRLPPEHYFEDQMSVEEDETVRMLKESAILRF